MTHRLGLLQVRTGVMMVQAEGYAALMSGVSATVARGLFYGGGHPSWSCKCTCSGSLLLLCRVWLAVAGCSYCSLGGEAFLCRCHSSGFCLPC